MQKQKKRKSLSNTPPSSTKHGGSAYARPHPVFLPGGVLLSDLRCYLLIFVIYIYIYIYLFSSGSQKRGFPPRPNWPSRKGGSRPICKTRRPRLRHMAKTTKQNSTHRLKEGAAGGLGGFSFACLGHVVHHGPTFSANGLTLALPSERQDGTCT